MDIALQLISNMKSLNLQSMTEVGVGMVTCLSLYVGVVMKSNTYACFSIDVPLWVRLGTCTYVHVHHLWGLLDKISYCY